MDSIQVDVIKFGGKTASVEKPSLDSDKSSLSRVRKILTKRVRDGVKVVIPVSAYSNTTNVLEELGRMLLVADNISEKEIRDYLTKLILEPHMNLADDIYLPKRETQHYLNEHVEGIVSSSLALLGAKSKLNLDDSLLGVHSPVPFTSVMSDRYYQRGRLGDLEGRQHDLDHVLDIKGYLDDIITRGERIMVKFYSDYLGGFTSLLETKLVLAEDVFVTDDNLGNAAINVKESTKKVQENLLPLLKNSNVKVIAVPGFYGANPDGKIRCFGRGGSDLSAVALSYLLKQCEGLYVSDPTLTKDTHAIMAVNPKAVYLQGKPAPRMGARSGSRKIKWINYDKIPTIGQLYYGDAMEISAVHTGAVQFAQKYELKMIIRDVNDYFGHYRSIISGAKTSKGMKLIGGTRDSVLLEMRGVCKDIPGEAVRIMEAFWKYGVNISKFTHFVGDTTILVNGGLENLDNVISILEGEFGPVTKREASQVRVTGDLEFGDKLQFEKLANAVGAYALSPWQESYQTLSAVFPKVENEKVDYYKALMSMFCMLFNGREQDAERLSKVLGDINHDYQRTTK